MLATLALLSSWAVHELPRFHESVFVGSVSSYDRTGGNDDGFSGAHSFVRKVAGGLVLADLEGPGVVTRIWTPTPTDDVIELYFDEEPEPRITVPFRELFTGTREPFIAPLVGRGAGGNFSYVPIPYRRSLKVVARAEKIQFYQINYATYPAGTDPPSWTDAAALLGSKEEDVHRFTTPPGAEVRTLAARTRVPPGTTSVLFDLSEPGRIVGLRLGPRSVLEDKERALVLRVTWDGAATPAIDVPVTDFFGGSFGRPAARSVLLGSSKDYGYVYFPMPFERSARIELVSDHTEPLGVEAELFFSPVPRAEDEGKLYALWHRENPTSAGRPFPFVRTRGRGHVVAVMLQAQGGEPGSTTFFEGDDVALIDGVLAAHGTGSEDFFNGGWYDVPGRWESRTSLPLSGCLDYEKHLGRTGGYRLLLSDAYAFRESIDLGIEHAPAGNDLPTDYTAVTFLYAADPPDGLTPLPPLPSRRVTEPSRIVFSPGWNVPIHASSLKDQTLAKTVEEIAGERVRLLSVRSTGEDIFGPHFVALALDVPASGRYRVLLNAVRGPSQGRIRLYQNEDPLGPAVDLFAAERGKSGLLELGEAELAEGRNVLFFRSAGKDDRSSGIGMDLVTIVLER
jgi:hypothetical protein